MDISRFNADNTQRVTAHKPCTHLYICDGKGCSRNCADVGHDMCYHTSDEKHANTKCRRQRKFSNEHGVYVEV